MAYTRTSTIVITTMLMYDITSAPRVHFINSEMGNMNIMNAAAIKNESVNADHTLIPIDVIHTNTTIAITIAAHIAS